MIPDDLLERMAEKFRMLGDPTRLRIVRALLDGEKSVSEVVGLTGQHQSNVSKHLRLLSEAGMVQRRKEGLQVFYSVNDPLIGGLCLLVCSGIRDETVAEIERHRRLLQDWQQQD